MAVYTDVSFEELETFLASYDVGKPRSFKGIAEGVENSNYFLQTDKDAYFLTLYEKRVREEDLPFFLGLMDHLAAKGIPCPVPVHDRKDRLRTTLNGRPAALLTFVQGVSLKKPEPAHCAAVGRALAAMHEAGKDFEIRRENALNIEGWRELEDSTRDGADTVESGLAHLISSTLAQLSREWPDGLPSGVVHTDLFPDNVLFMDGKVSALIDFYFACNDSFAYDLAVMLNSWCFETDGSYNVTKSRALIAAYEQKRQLTAGEISALPTLARGAALRFLLTRLFDWLNPSPSALVRPKDPREYSRKLRFHMKVRSAAEYGL
ncbi:MAG TPA: homoserine kinase [Rhizomicrobium sp.]|jgi:homoserine kinase type II|nr:homoserine kinase [Rhizomicrobium sp.]